VAVAVAVIGIERKGKSVVLKRYESVGEAGQTVAVAVAVAENDPK
jgi:hypothetical protein